MLRLVCSRLLRTSFIRNVGVLVAGNTGAQLLMLLAVPILTRLYSPDAFGLLAVFVGVLSIISVIANFRYELAIPLPESDEEAFAVSVVALMVSTCVALITGVVIFLLGPYLAGIAGASRVADYSWLIPIGVFLIGGYQVSRFWAVRSKAFGQIAKSRMYQALVTIFFQISTFKLGVIGLVAGHTVGQGAGIPNLYRPLAVACARSRIGTEDLKAAVIKYKSFPIFGIWAGLTNTLGQHLPAILFATFFGAGSAGVYALAQRIVAMPLNVIGRGISSVFLSNAAEQMRAGTLANNVEQLQQILIKLVLPPVLFLILFAPDIFGIIFGREWQFSGVIASWLSLWMLVSFSTSPISMIFSVVEKQGAGLIMQLWLLACRALAIVVGIICDDFLFAVILFSLASVVGYVGYLLVAFHYVGASRLILLKSFFLSLFLVYLTMLLSKYVELSFLISMSIFGVLSAIYYFLLLKGVSNA